MKKYSSIFLAAILAVILCSCSPGRADVAVNEANFPDKNFRDYVLTNCDKDGDGNLSNAEIASVTEIDVAGQDMMAYPQPQQSDGSEIYSLKGIEYFTSLVSLNCSWNKLTELDLSKNTSLEILNCSSNGTFDSRTWSTSGGLASLNVAACRNLKELNCGNNNLTTLDVSKNTALEVLDCAGNQLKALDVSGFTSLCWLDIDDNPLVTLNARGCTALQEINIEACETLTVLDLRGCTALDSVSCSECPNLSVLNLTGCTALQWLYCAECNLSALDISTCTALKEIECGYNPLTELDLRNNNNLYLLSIPGTNIRTLNFPSKNNNELDIECDFTAEDSGDVYTFDLTAFKETYHLDGELNTSSKYQAVYGHEGDKESFERLDGSINTSSDRYVMSFPKYDGDKKLIFIHFWYKSKAGQNISFTAMYNPDFEQESDSVSESVPPIITTYSLPQAAAGTSYTHTLTATGDTPITWTLSGGSLPDGLSLGSSGILYGTPDKAGAYYFTVQATNSAGTASQTLSLIVPFSTAIAPSINAESLTNALKGAAYGFQFTASGTSPLTWSLAEGSSLPDGLTLSTSGYLSGTPTAAGTSSFTVQAENSAGSSSAAFTLTTSDAPSGTQPKITTEEIDSALADSQYSYQLTASGTPPFTWTVKGNLPDGLKMDSSGLITGTPQKKASKKITVTAKNDFGTDTKKLVLKVKEIPYFTTESLKTAKAGKKYSAAIKAKGSDLSWKFEGDIPDGLTLDEDTHKISGIPTTNTTGMLRVTISNDEEVVVKVFMLSVDAAAPTISTKSLKTGKYGKEYKTVIKTKGTDPIKLTLSGKLPAGLSFDSEAGTITGTPEEACTDQKITLTASNMAGSEQKEYLLTIKAIAPKFQTKKLPDAVKGKPYSADIEVTGTPEIMFTASGLPSGLSISNDGTISGTPTEFGKFKAAITATNAAKAGKKNLKLVVLGAPEISESGTLASGTQGKSYKHTFTATGSKTITFSIAKGSLPGGLTLNAKGKLSGKPTASGTFEFTVKAANSAGEDSKDFTVTIAASTNNKSAYTAPNDGNVSVIQNRSSRGNTSTVENLAPENAGSDSDAEYTIVAELPEVSVDVAGMYDFSVELGENAQAGDSLVWLANSEEPSADDGIAEFFTEDGQEIDSVPESKKVNVSAWLNEGVIYRPVIAVKR